MQYLSTLLTLLAAAQSINGSPVEKRSEGLNVELSQVGNTRIKAVVTNTGSEPITFVHANWLKSAAPVKKVSVYKNANEVEFEGVKLRIKTKDLSEDVLTTLAPGATLEDEFDIAATTNLASGGPVTISSKGFLPTTSDSQITGSIAYSSNELTIDVDGAEAAKVATVARSIVRRTQVECSDSSKNSDLDRALSNTISLANAAAQAALNGDSRFTTFFKTSASATRSDVAARLRAVAAEAGSTTSGATQYYCEDEFGYCETNVLAWTLPSQNIIANCDIYYTYLPDLASSCYDQDMATTSLHEFTHAPGVYSPGTDDLGYGYAAATALSSADALNNADSYALYANAVYLGC